jgi:DNA-binding SARP family transcriptional activator
LTNYGRGREVAALIDDSLSYVDDPKLVKRLQVARLAAATHSGAYLPAQQAFRSSDLAAEDPSVYGPLLDFIEATIALRRGSYARGIALLEESVRIVRRSGLISSLQVTLSNIVFEAWLVGDDERFMAALAELRGSLLPGVERAWQFLLDAAASPQTATPTGFEFASVRSIGHLIIAAGVEGSAAVEHAESAVREADAADDIGIRVIARLALAELVPARRATAIEEARALAKRIDLTEVGDGVAAFERHEAGGLYAAFAERRLRRNERVEPLLVHFAGSRITRDGQAVAVSTVEFALILFLAAARRPVSRTTIQDSLWPDSDEAANGLKVYVHRVRKKLGVDCIARSGDGYVVGPHVSLDLVRAEESLRSAHEKSKGDLRLQLRAIVTEFDTTADSRLQRYDWYESLSRRADELTRAAALHLARTHYDTGAVEFSCLQARFERDPTDEDVCETLIESLLIMNRAPAARRLVERFRLAAERDGDEFSTRRARDFLIRVSAGLREVDRRKVR